MTTNITDVYKNSFINAVITANKELYNYIHYKLKQSDLEYSNTIGYGGDNSLNIDLIAEEIFIKHLKEYGNIYSEECGYLDFNKEFEIIIDPIDGSDNFYSNLEYYGSSVALKVNNKTIAGFVCNLATSLMIYRAFESEKIEFYLDEKKVISRVSNSKFGIFERAYKYPELVSLLNSKNMKFRALGAAAVSLASAHKFDFVLFLGEIREFDIAASLYICNDLNIYKSGKSLCITKNKHNIQLIKEIIKEE